MHKNLVTGMFIIALFVTVKIVQITCVQTLAAIHLSKLGHVVIKIIQ